MSRAKVAAGFLIAATAVLAWIAVVKFAVAPSFKLDPTTDLSRLYRVELSSLSRTEAPSIVVLGSSRAAFGIDPLTIERRLSLPARSVVNAGFPGFYDVLLEQFVERNADYLRKARIVVIVVDDNAGVYAKVVAAAPAV